MRVLIVEDEPKMAGLIRRGLREEGYAADVAGTGEDATWMAAATDYDAIVLDVLLPGANGFDVCRELRRSGIWSPVLMLTARDSVDDRVAGLDAGADDYLGKPFDLAEVEARLRALVRRAQGTEDIATLGRLRLDRKARRFSVAGAPLDLPAREFEVLWELMSPPGRTVSKRAMSDKLSSFDEALGDNALEAFISRLRKKLAGSGAAIRTLRGIGYLLEAAE
jgi:DNA-binding response OmpR family regulator